MGQGIGINSMPSEVNGGLEVVRFGEEIRKVLNRGVKKVLGDRYCSRYLLNVAIPTGSKEVIDDQDREVIIQKIVKIRGKYPEVFGKEDVEEVRKKLESISSNVILGKIYTQHKLYDSIVESIKEEEEKIKNLEDFSKLKEIIQLFGELVKNLSINVLGEYVYIPVFLSFKDETNRAERKWVNLLNVKFGVKFFEMLVLQNHLNIVIDPIYPINYFDKSLRHVGLAFLEELGELLQSTRVHKWWSKKPYNREQLNNAIIEIVDQLHFYLTLVLKLWYLSFYSIGGNSFIKGIGTNGFKEAMEVNSKIEKIWETQKETLKELKNQGILGDLLKEFEYYFNPIKVAQGLSNTTNEFIIYKKVIDIEELKKEIQRVTEQSSQQDKEKLIEQVKPKFELMAKIYGQINDELEGKFNYSNQLGKKLGDILLLKQALAGMVENLYDVVKAQVNSHPKDGNSSEVESEKLNRLEKILERLERVIKEVKNGNEGELTILFFDGDFIKELEGLVPYIDQNLVKEFKGLSQIFKNEAVSIISKLTHKTLSLIEAMEAFMGVIHSIDEMVNNSVMNTLLMNFGVSSLSQLSPELRMQVKKMIIQAIDFDSFYQAIYDYPILRKIFPTIDDFRAVIDIELENGNVYRAVESVVKSEVFTNELLTISVWHEHLAMLLGTIFYDIRKVYLLKNILNIIRQKKGYKDNYLAKYVGKDIEDNQILMEMVMEGRLKVNTSTEKMIELLQGWLDKLNVDVFEIKLINRADAQKNPMGNPTQTNLINGEKSIAIPILIKLEEIEGYDTLPHFIKNVVYKYIEELDIDRIEKEIMDSLSTNQSTPTN